MQNMGVGPLSGPPPAPPPAAAPQRPAGGPVSAAEAEIRSALEAALPAARETDLFARLSVPRGASVDEVKSAYLRLVKQFHPDRYAAPGLADLQPGLRELLSSLNEAYATLSDRQRRSDYLARTSTGGRAATEAAAAAAAPAPAAAADPTEQLKKLAELHDAGILSDEEFAASKKKALGI